MGAAEPTATELARQAAFCLNCGARVSGAYCSACGQRARVHRSLGAFFADFAAGLFNFDGKFWRTLPMLAWRPGELTRLYVEGHRVRFISPVALYLFTVFLMFAVLNFTGTLGPLRISGELGVALTQEQRALDQLEAQRERVRAAGGSLVEIDRRITSARSDIDDLRKLQAGQAPVRIEGMDGSPEFIRRAVVRAAADPELAVAKVQEAASKYSWLLIPLSLPVMRLLFPLRRRLLFAHTVFVTYSLSFMMLLIIAAGLLVLAGASALAPWLALAPPVHLYRQLREAYDLERFGALLRTALLMIAAMFVLVAWFLAIVALGLLN